jgi:hypothetical protein
MVVGKHSNLEKKMTSTPAMPHPTKAKYTIVLGQYASQNNCVFLKLKVVPKICVQLHIAPRIGVNHPNGIHDALS